MTNMEAVLEIETDAFKKEEISFINIKFFLVIA